MKRVDITERDSTFWTVFGFSMGLTAAFVAVYLILRNRFQRSNLENQTVELSQNSSLGSIVEPVGSREVHSLKESTPAMVLSTSMTDSTPQQATEPLSSTSQQEQPEHTMINILFLGIVSSKRYYPVETPLGQLATSVSEPLDVVYFSSEDDAKAQGFKAE